MARGKTFSITIPHKMVNDYDRIAKELSLSRSKVVFNILLNAWNNSYPNTALIDCDRALGTHCQHYDKECDIDNPKDCIAYLPLKE